VVAACDPLQGFPALDAVDKPRIPGIPPSVGIRAALTVIVAPRVNVDGFDGKKADATPLTHATGTQEFRRGGRGEARVTMAKRLVVLIAQSLAQYPYADLRRYPGGTEPGISRSAYGLLGTGSALLELRGGIGTKRLHPDDRLPCAARDRPRAGEDPTLAAFRPEDADLLGVPTNGQAPSQGPGEAIEEGYVPGLRAEADDFHLGN